MQALILGCGYLGKRVALEWLKAGTCVFAVTRNPQTAISFHQLGIQPLVADVCDFSSLRNLPEVDTVLYSVGFDRQSTRSQEEVTCGGIQNVLTVMSGRCRRFIDISSTSVYGQSDGEWVDEESTCAPIQTNGQLTWDAEERVRNAFAGNDRVQASVMRLAGIYGQNRLLSRIESLRSGQPLAGRGDSWLNLIHVDDAVTAILACAAHESPAKIYNVVDDQPIRRRDYFERLATLIGAPPPTFDSTLPNARGSGGLNKRCSNRKIRHELDWAPVYESIETGLPASINVADDATAE